MVLRDLYLSLKLNASKKVVAIKIGKRFRLKRNCFYEFSNTIQCLFKL